MLLVIVAVVAFMRAMRDPGFRLRVHRKLVTTPMIGTMLRAADSARLASTLGILGRSGVPLVDALFIAAQVVGNLEVRNAVKNAAAKVREGGSLSRALDASGYFPPMLVQMIASGEASGELDHMLTRAADYQERELSSTVNTMVGLLGPIMLLFMAGVVVLIVLSVMLPIMQMNNLLAG
jgi:general secretion pathway protein F